MLCVCVGDVMDVVFSVCIVRNEAVGARVWEVWVFRHADVVCLCLVCILWQSPMLRSPIPHHFSSSHVHTISAYHFK